MEDNRPYVKRINLGIDTRNPDYKKAYDYIMEHKGGKFRFICDCVLQVMEGRKMQEPQQKTSVSSPEMLSMISENPEVLQSLALAVVQLMPSVQPQQEKIEAIVVEDKKIEEDQDVMPAIDDEPVSAYPNEEKNDMEESGAYDGPVLDADMLAGLGAWDEFLE